MDWNGSSVGYRLEEGVAHLTLTQADRGNPIDATLGTELMQIANHLATDRAVRAVLLTGEGRFFSVGGDIRSFTGNLEALPRLILDWTATFHTALMRLRQINAPVVCAVQGAVAGGSVSMMAFSDVVYAAENTRFTAAFPALGFCADSGTTVSLSQRMGIARARRFILANETLSTEEALGCGLVDHVVAADQLQAEALAQAKRFAEGPTQAYGEIKRSFQNALGNTLERQLEIEAFALSAMAGTADAREGITAFAAKRKPAFTG